MSHTLSASLKRNTESEWLVQIIREVNFGFPNLSFLWFPSPGSWRAWIGCNTGSANTKKCSFARELVRFKHDFFVEHDELQAAETTTGFVTMYKWSVLSSAACRISKNISPTPSELFGWGTIAQAVCCSLWACTYFLFCAIIFCAGRYFTLQCTLHRLKKRASRRWSVVIKTKPAIQQGVLPGKWSGSKSPPEDPFSAVDKNWVFLCRENIYSSSSDILFGVLGEETCSVPWDRRNTAVRRFLLALKGRLQVWIPTMESWTPRKWVEALRWGGVVRPRVRPRVRRTFCCGLQ